MEVAPQFQGEFDRPRRTGDVLVQWRNRKLSRDDRIEQTWKKYKFMSALDAEEFMKNCAPGSTYFEYRIVKPVDKNRKS